MAHQEQESTVIDTIVIVVIIVTNAGQMSVSGGNRASDTRDPSLMHKIAMTELEMAATGQPPTDMISHTGVSQTTGGQITQTGAPDVPACNSCIFSECQTNDYLLIIMRHSEVMQAAHEYAVYQLLVQLGCTVKAGFS